MRRTSSPRQLTLALGFAESFAREDFLEGPSNTAALGLIERWPDWPAHALVVIGPEGCGKSHLAAIWAGRSGARFLAARAIDVAAVPAALATGALVVEDLAPGRFDERALFHLLNLSREEGAFLLLTARTDPATWQLALADLASRLRALPVIPILPPDEALMRAGLVKLFADRQLKVDEALVAYLAARLDRSFAAARAAVNWLDREALERQRPLTRALAAELLREQPS
jgi:chromosomal replication initiation ATPase DnaA